MNRRLPIRLKCVMDTTNLVYERLRAYFKKQIDLQTVKRIVVQTFNTTTPPPVQSTIKDVGTKFTKLHTDIEPIISKKSLDNLKKYIKFTNREGHTHREGHTQSTVKTAIVTHRGHTAVLIQHFW